MLKFLSPKYSFARARQEYLAWKYRDLKLRIGMNCSLYKVKLGKSVYLGNFVTLHNSSLGDHSYVNGLARIKNTTVGKYCSIAPGVKIVLGAHPTDLISMHPAFYSVITPVETFADKQYFDEYREVKTGNDVWIGEDVVIHGGVTIGDGAVIAARAVVTKDVEPYSVVGGVPAKFIKFRFSPERIAELQQIRWWDRDEKWIKENFKLFLNVDNFFEYFRK